MFDVGAQTKHVLETSLSHQLNRLKAVPETTLLSIGTAQPMKGDSGNSSVVYWNCSTDERRFWKQLCCLLELLNR
jgi:hypothetical protein